MELDDYLVDVLMPDLVGHDRHPSAFLVYLFLARHATSSEEPFEMSLTRIAEGTGLSKRAVQSAITRLAGRRLILAERETITAVGRFEVRRPWRSPRRST